MTGLKPSTVDRIVVTHFDRILKFPLNDRQVYRIGSSQGADLRVPFKGVSRFHAVLASNSEGWCLLDCGSKNGLVVQGRACDRIQLTPEQEIRLGEVSLVLESVSPDETVLAIAFENRDSTLQGATETDAVKASNRVSRDLIRFMRRWSQALDEEFSVEDLLRESRECLHCKTLVRSIRSDSGQRILKSVIGPISAEQIQKIESLDADDSVVETDDLTGIIHTTEGDQSSLIAWYEKSIVYPSWTTDFLEFLHSRLFGFLSIPGVEESVEVQRPIPEGFIGSDSPAMRALIEEVRRIAPSDYTILLTGETGTGKEMFARLIHDWSHPKDRPWVPINCAAIPADLLEAELFGIEKGIATGVDRRDGLFAAAQGGTLFLDEVGEIPINLQAKLLRVLQERTIRRLGEKKDRPIEVRIIAATNQDLETRVRNKEFRPDLYCRLRQIELRLPPLRERLDDLPALVLALLQKIARQHRKRIRGVSLATLQAFRRHSWPGNIRELEALLARWVLTCPEGGVLESQEVDLKKPSEVEPSESDPSLEPFEHLRYDRSLKEGLDEVERNILTRTLRECQGNKSEASRRLGISRRGLDLKINRLDSL